MTAHNSFMTQLGMNLYKIARCLKSTEKVSFNIASEASYVYILSGQKWSILASFWKPEACGQTVLPDRSVVIGQKLAEKAKIQKFKYDILSNFQTMWPMPVRLDFAKVDTLSFS